MDKQWYALSPEAISKELGADLKNGLTNDEAGRRIAKYGSNELPKKKKLQWWQLFFRQFKSPLVFILLVAALLTISLKEFIDTGVILLSVFVNVLIGFFQEYRSSKIFEKLQAAVKVEARFLRNGKITEADSAVLVPGDIIILKSGARVPADARLISAENLETNESLLTGESTAVKKEEKTLNGEIPLADRTNMVHTGTIITQGEGVALVIATGAATEIGVIAGLTAKVTEETTPLQERLGHLGKIISFGVMAVAIIIFTVGVLEEHSLLEMFTVAVAVAVAAIPEGLPAALSVVLAVASQKIFRSKGLVKKLIAAETLGSTTVIAADKTGTLTEGRMKIEDLLEISDAKQAGLILGLANEAIIIKNSEGKDEIRGEGTDKAKMEFFIENGGDLEKTLSDLPRKAFLPFDSDEKYLASFHIDRNNKLKIFVTGAPEKILQLSAIGPAEHKKLALLTEQRASQGFRMIGMAERTLESHDSVDFKNISSLKAQIKNLAFIGIAALRDPIREDVKESVREARKAGIKVIMITGDHRLTALTIGRELGFRADPAAVMEGAELDKLSDEQLFSKIDPLEIFARTSPKHKIRIVEALKKRREVVAMTGDGINDAPALKAADIGVAIGSGTDIAKEASDLVLLDNSFSVITAAIKHGRIAFDNIRKVVVFLLSNSFTELILVLTPLIFRIPLPITAVQILWANLIEDGLPNFALAFEPGDKNVMKRKPFKRNEPILDREGKILVFIMGIIRDLILAGVFLSFYFLSGLPIEYIRTIVFAALATDSLVYVFSMKSLSESIFTLNLFDNLYLLLAVIIGFMLMIAAVYAPPLNHLLKTVPLSPKDALLVLGLGGMNIIFVEIVKWWFRRNGPEIAA